MPISPAQTPDDLATVADLFAAYAASLEVDLGYEDFDAELVGLPGQYAPPAGCLLLARDASGVPLGCVALRPIAPDGCCEMKRLYVTPAGRGLGLGKALVKAIIGEARRVGYREMRLDTFPSMHAAQVMYRAAGFRPIEPYCDAPVPGTLFLGLDLTPPERGASRG